MAEVDDGDVDNLTIDVDVRCKEWSGGGLELVKAHYAC